MIETWPDRFAAQLAIRQRRRDARQHTRTQLATARAAGLEARHATKTARLPYCTCGHLEVVHALGRRGGAPARTKCRTMTGPEGTPCPCKTYTPGATT